MTLVAIDCFAGRSDAAKRVLYADVVRRLGEHGIPANDITIVMREIPQIDWGIRSGLAACDVDLGFDVEV